MSSIRLLVVMGVEAEEFPVDGTEAEDASPAAPARITEAGAVRD